MYIIFVGHFFDKVVSLTRYRIISSTGRFIDSRSRIYKFKLQAITQKSTVSSRPVDEMTLSMKRLVDETTCRWNDPVDETNQIHDIYLSKKSTTFIHVHVYQSFRSVIHDSNTVQIVILTVRVHPGCWTPKTKFNPLQLSRLRLKFNTLSWLCQVRGINCCHQSWSICE